MKKELKSCKDVLLRADLTGHGHPTLFGRKSLETYFAPFIFLDFRIVCNALFHKLRTPGEEIAVIARTKIHSHSQILGMAEAYFVCHIGQNFQISLIYAFIGCP